MAESNPSLNQVAPVVNPPIAVAATSTPAPESSILLLRNPESKLEFGRLDSDHTINTVIVNPAAWNNIPVRVYQAMQRCLPPGVANPMNQANFVRVCRTLLLKRVQDVIEEETGLRPGHFVRMSRNILIPTPIAELLGVIGSYTSGVLGIRFDVTQPAHPAAQVPDWWEINGQLLDNWNTLMALCARRYMITSFPRQSDWRVTPFMLTNRHVNEDLVYVKAYTNEPKMSDAFIRFVNEDVFAPSPYAIDSCHLIMTEELILSSVAAAYVNSYFIRDQL